MNAQYDAIAEAYSRGKESPLRRHIETWSFDRMLGDVRGLRVLDLACGDGFYARRIRAAGAERVVGVDISAAMIALANQEEARQPAGIEYHCADVAQLPDLGEFDLVSAAYLLHYAPDVEALVRMCERVAAQLRPGGRFVSINEHPDHPDDPAGRYTRYGFNKSVAQPVADGATIHYTMISGRSVMEFDARYFSRATYEDALRDAGFTGIEWTPLALDPAGVEAHGDDYFRDYLAAPPVTGLQARLGTD